MNVKGGKLLLALAGAPADKQPYAYEYCKLNRISMCPTTLEVRFFRTHRYVQY